MIPFYINDATCIHARPHGSNGQATQTHDMLNAIQVGNECSKYGAVQRVIIFEVTEPGYPSDQAVRIFIEFDRPESATKALVDLEGRFFGGRTVRATFYDESKFEREEVAPFPGED